MGKIKPGDIIKIKKEFQGMLFEKKAAVDAIQAQIDVLIGKEHAAGVSFWKTVSVLMPETQGYNLTYMHAENSILVGGKLKPHERKMAKIYGKQYEEMEEKNRK